MDVDTMSSAPRGANLTPPTASMLALLVSACSSTMKPGYGDAVFSVNKIRQVLPILDGVLMSKEICESCSPEAYEMQLHTFM